MLTMHVFKLPEAEVSPGTNFGPQCLGSFHTAPCPRRTLSQQSRVVNILISSLFLQGCIIAEAQNTASLQRFLSSLL